MDAIRDFLSSPFTLSTWIILSLISTGILIYDLQKNNSHLGSLMKWVWGLTVLYSGPVGLAVYFYSGRRQMARDSLWRKGFRSVAHCYSGCGGGEVAGVIIAVGLLSLGNLWVSIITFFLAYVAGFGMTVGPLIQEGVSFRHALKDAFYSESVSITVMEVVAIGTDLYLAQDAKIGETLFWTSLFTSLSIGLIAAYPVNVLLIHWGVKEGMHNPKESMNH